MPTYPYQCTACQAEWDEEQSIRSEPTEACPTCGGAARRMIGGSVRVVFKGVGWTPIANRHKVNPLRGDEF